MALVEVGCSLLESFSPSIVVWYVVQVWTLAAVTGIGSVPTMNSSVCVCSSLQVSLFTVSNVLVNTYSWLTSNDFS